MRRVGQASLALAVAAALLGGTVAASAQEATPAAAGGLGPGPEECTVETRSAESLAAVFGAPLTGTPAGAPPAVGDVPFGSPDGEPADAETVAAVTAVIRQEWACLNANDVPRVLALYSDDLIRAAFSPEQIAEIGGTSLNALGTVTAGTPEPVPTAEQSTLFAVLDVERLGEGRAGAYVVVDTAGDPLPVEVNYDVLVETEAGWLLDGFFCFDEAGGPCA